MESTDDESDFHEFDGYGVSHPVHYHEAQLGDNEGKGWYGDDHVVELSDHEHEDELHPPTAVAADDGDGADQPAPGTEGGAAARRASSPAEPLRSRSADDAAEPVLSEQQMFNLAEAVDGGEGGLIWHAQVVKDGVVLPRLCNEDGTIKPRRPLPHIYASDFFRSLVKTRDDRWIFVGKLNGWPALKCLELRSITSKVKKGFLGAAYIKRFWDVASLSALAPPSFPTHSKVTGVRVTLRAAPWTANGFSKAVQGFCFWLRAPARFGPATVSGGGGGGGGASSSHPLPGPAVMQMGTNMCTAADAAAAAATLNGEEVPVVTKVHHFAHRYAKAKGQGETAKDRLTWHCGCLLEWSDGRGITIVELAWWSGLGGYGGKSNWSEDKNEKRTALYAAMPSAMKAPWRSDMAEVRLIDHAKTLEEFQAYLAHHSGPDGAGDHRFLKAVVDKSSDVRLSAPFCTEAAIATYVCNYVQAETHYSEEARNCQTFAADFYSFLSGDSSVHPYAPLNQLLYKPKQTNFLYAPSPGAKFGRLRLEVESRRARIATLLKLPSYDSSLASVRLRHMAVNVKVS